MDRPFGPVHTCALPPGWVEMRSGLEAVWWGPMPTAQELWDRFVTGPEARP